MARIYTGGPQGDAEPPAMVNSQTSAAASQPMESCTMIPEYTNDSSLSDKTTSLDTQLRPFPTDNLAQELVHLILYHVLSEPDFGGNGRWATRDEATREKLQWSRAHKQRAAVHKKFSLIHRSWTPYVLRSLYRSPRLTSKFAIQRLTDCLQHPEKLWGVEVSKETGKVVGGVVGDRRYFVRHLGWHIGTGRESSMDWIMYSGEWISLWATNLVALSPRLSGWEIEGWCSRDCNDEGYQEQNQELIAESDRLQSITRVSMARVPSAASLLNVVLGCYPTLRELELLEMSRTILGDDRSKEFVYRALRDCRLQVLGLKVAGGNRRAGVLDDVLEIIPEIRHLYLAADLISPEFFNNQLPKHLQEILLGCSTRKPIVFSGREAVEAFWKIGRTFANSNSAYMERTNTTAVGRYPTYSSDDNCDIASSGGLAALHQRYRYDQDYPPLAYEHDYAQKLTDAIVKDRSSYELKVQPFDWENAFAYDVASTEGQIPPVGLECWLVEEMREAGSLRAIAMPDSEISRVVQALCWRD